MTRGTLLDDYLMSNGAATPLTDAELDLQLQRPQGDQPSSSPQIHPSLLTPPEDSTTVALLSKAFAEIESAQERDDAIDTAVKTASHGVKVLAPILSAVSNWVDPESQPEELERIMGILLARVRKDALVVAKAYGVAAEDSPAWLTSQISGQLVDILVRAVERNNGAVLKEEDTKYLAPLLNLANQADGISTSFYAAPHNAQWQLINALTLATAEVMTEYHAFNYFHDNPTAISQQITDYLNERVIDGTLAQMTARFGLTDSERGYLGCTLIKQAGRLLADAWGGSVTSTLEAIKELPKESRRELLVHGYPLDEVFDDFEAMYQGLEVSSESAMRSLAPHRENLQQDQGHGFKLG